MDELTITLSKDEWKLIQRLTLAHEMMLTRSLEHIPYAPERGDKRLESLDLTYHLNITLKKLL